MTRAHCTLLAVAPLLLAPLQDLSRDDPRFSPEAAEVVADRRARVRAEVLEESAPAWVGEYYCGDGTGKNVSLALSPSAGFAYEWRGCMGVYDRNYGAVRENAERLVLAPEHDNTDRLYRVPAEFFPVRWGERTYLLASDEVMDFVNDVHSGYEPRKGVHGRHLLRRGDEKLPVEGRPDLPEHYAGALLDEPVRAGVLAVRVSEDEDATDRYRGVVELELDRGARDGVLIGHRFHLLAEGVRETCRVVEVRAETCVVSTRTFETTHPLPPVGSAASTHRWTLPRAKLPTERTSPARRR